MIKQSVLICGTDTDCGKTYFSVQLLQACQRLAISTVALKPLASDCVQSPLGLRNQDALYLQQAASIQLPYERVNPLAFSPAISPNIAAQQANEPLSVNALLTACQAVSNINADLLLVEGCGGWMCPINQRETMADFAKALNLPVILVVGLRLGCLNHTLLTWHHMQQQGIACAGWIANHVTSQKMLAVEENIQTLIDFLGQPPLAILGHQQCLDDAVVTNICRFSELC